MEETTVVPTMVAWVLLVLTTGTDSRAPPAITTLSDSSNSISILASQNFTLNCEGEEPITWRTHNTNSISERTIIKEFKTITDLNRYGATLTVTNTIFTDTGYFTCSYKDINNSESPDDKVDIYVFVNDPDHLFLQCSTTSTICFIPVPQSMETVIPCLPTSLDVNVTLWKEQPPQIILANDVDVSFDPTRGFVIAFGSSFYNGEFKCIGQLDDRTEPLNFVLYWFPSVDFPTPIIQQGAKYAVLNSNYTMLCSVKVQPEVYLLLEWQYPAAASERIKIGDQQSIIRTMAIKETYQEIIRNITVMKIQADDQGIYTCTAKDSTGKTKEKSVYITTQGETDAFINLTLSGDVPNNTFELSLAKTREVKFVVNVDAFPDDPQLTWYMYNRPLTERKKYYIRSTRTSSSLTIFNIQRNDTGQYSLNGITGNVSANITMTLILTEPPLITVQPLTKLYRLGEAFAITCYVQGCPLRSDMFTWEWSRCNNPEHCEKDYRLLEGSADNSDITIQKSHFGHGCNLWNTVSGIMTTPGYYKCSAENPHGNVSLDVPLFITDYSGKLGITDHSANVYEQDQLTLLCYASIFYFSSVRWKWMPKNGNSSIIMGNSTEAFVVPGKTDYSWTTEIKFNAINKKDSGNYTCEAKCYDSPDTWETTTTAISVIGVQPPTVLETNLNNSIIEVYKEDSVEFICQVIGVPLPKLTWYLNGTEILDIKPSAVEIKDNRTRLFISRAIPSDSGFYVCEAKNKVGTLLLNTTLAVLDISSRTRNAIILTVVLFIASVAIALRIAFGRKVWKEKKKQREIAQLQKLVLKRGDLENYNPELPLEDQVDCLPYDNQWEFPKSKLKLERTIGQGAFGRVVRARATEILKGQESTIVAVKMLKERAALVERRALMQELKIMIHLGHHVNVVNLLGAVTENLHKGELLVITEYCRFGNLRHYLLKNRDNFVSQINPTTGEIDPSVMRRATPNDFLGRDSSLSTGVSSGHSSTCDSHLLSNGTESLLSDGSSNNNRLSSSTTKSGISEMLTTNHLVYYAFQISSGMQYLSSKKLVHRDLALRNVLLADGHIVKICDFGLSKDLYKKIYYRRKGKGPLPVKWMAVESICDEVFSSESDVWSFGIVLWETFTLGANPYPGMEVNDEFYKKLINGYRMEKPALSTDLIYTLMKDCWESHPRMRPTFDQICIRLHAMLDESIINRTTLPESSLDTNPFNSSASVSRNTFPSHREHQKAKGQPSSSNAQSDYVPCDNNSINVDAKSVTVNYVNLPLPIRRAVEEAPEEKVSPHELQPLLSNIAQGQEMISNTSNEKTSLAPSDSSPKDQSAYLDMGSKLSLSTNLENIL